jgi:hypothetical protein
VYKTLISFWPLLKTLISKERCSEVWSKIWVYNSLGWKNFFYGRPAKKFYLHGPTYSKGKLWIFSCDSARDAWCVSSRRLQKKSSMTFENFFQVVEDTFEQGDSEEIRLFVGIARRLWLRRNDVVYGGSLLHPSLLVQKKKFKATVKIIKMNYYFTNFIYLKIN